MNHTHIRPYFLALLLVVFATLTFYLFQPFLIPLALGAIFAAVLYPMQPFIRRYLKLPRGGIAILTLFIGVVFLAIPLTFITTQLVMQAENVYGAATNPESLVRLQAAFAETAVLANSLVPGTGIYITNLSQNLGVYAQQALGWVISHAGGAFTGTLRFLLYLFIFLTSAYYLLKEGPLVRKTILRLSPLAREETTALMTRLHRTVDSVVKGSLTIAAIQGVLVAVGFALFGIPNAILWGTIASIGALIPGVGTSIVMIGGVLFLFLSGNVPQAIGLGIWALVFVGSVDNVLSPHLIGGRAAIHPLLIMLSILGGAVFFGPAGIFLGPLIMSFFIGLLAIYSPNTGTDDIAMEEAPAR